MIHVSISFNLTYSLYSVHVPIPIRGNDGVSYYGQQNAFDIILYIPGIKFAHPCLYQVTIK